MPEQNPTLTVECASIHEFEAAVAAMLAMRAVIAAKEMDNAVVIRMVIVKGRLVAASRKITTQRDRYTAMFDKAVRQTA